MAEHDVPVELVVFDLGNVIVPWERRRALERFVDDPTEVERLADEVFTMEVNHLLDLGHPLEEIRAAIEAAHPGYGWVIDSYVEHFRHSLGPVIEGTVTLVDDLLNAGVRCVGLTNWSAICWRGIPESIPVLERLEGIVVSGEIGISKPNPAIFGHLEDRFGARGRQLLFFDDNVPNIEAARAFGWRAEVFTTPEQARADVVRAGLLTH
jgi:2-haloacid dehalogenase